MTTMTSPIDDLTHGDASQPAVEVHQVVKVFPQGTRAVDGVDLQLATGEVVALLGHNGAGKTTIVRLIAGLLHPTAGTVRVLGRDPIGDGPWVRRRLGVLPANGVLDLRQTARENLDFVGRVFGLERAHASARAAELLEEFELTDHADQRVATFSQGMRQRLSLARVLLPGPSVLLLDEPTSALDPVAARDVRTLIKDCSARGVTVVLCTHDLAEASEVCDRVLILKEGQVIAQGPPSELARRATSAHTVELQLDTPALLAGVLPAGASWEATGPQSALVRGVAGDAVADLVTALVSHGARLRAVRPTEPTLTDLYLSLHGAAPEPTIPTSPRSAS